MAPAWPPSMTESQLPLAQQVVVESGKADTSGMQTVDSSPQSRTPHEENLSRNIGKTCLAISGLIGILCILAGIFILCFKQSSQNNVLLPPNWPGGRPSSDLLPGFVALFPDASDKLISKEHFLRLAFTVAYIFCQESIGFVYSVAQVSALAQTGNLGSKEFLFQFDTIIHGLVKFKKLEKLAPSKSKLPTFHPNGSFFNSIVHLVQMIGASSLSFSALTFLADTCTSGDSVNCSDQIWESVCISGIPILLLGLSITFQAALALWAICKVKIITWDLSPLVVVGALIREGLVSRTPGKCMRSVFDSQGPSGNNSIPKKPTLIQPSAMDAHPLIKKAILGYGAYVLALVLVGVRWYNDALNAFDESPSAGPSPSWGFFPSQDTVFANVIPPSDSGQSSSITTSNWAIGYLLLFSFQGVGLSAAQHIFLIVFRILQDEHIWRKASSPQGIAPQNVVVKFFSFWPNIIQLLVAKIFFNWVFGLCLSLQGAVLTISGLESSTNNVVLLAIVRPIQTWYLAGFVAIFGIFATIISRRSPKGSQPPAFGHIQTLANLIDDWPAPNEPMYWGHKGIYSVDENSQSVVYHAGTSSSPLPPVNENWMYA